MGGEVPAGWYPDPNAADGGLRYWGGSTWTEHTHPPPPRASIPPPSALVEIAPVTPTTADDQSPAVKWVTHNAIFAPINGTVWMSMAAAWTALGASAAGATVAALALCVAVPIFGWFLGIPIVLACAMVGACIWVLGYVGIFAGWASVTAAVALYTFCYQHLKAQR